MPFDRPSLQQLITRAQTDIETALPGADARLRRTVEGVLARVVSGMAHGLHGHVAWAARQVHPATAEGEQLRQWAAVWGLEPKAATPAAGFLEVTVASGTVVIPSDTRWRRADGALYLVTEDTEVTGTAAVPVEAVAVGAAGNTGTGATFSLTSPIAGVTSAALVASPGLTGGADDERDADLLARVVQRVSHPSRAGGPGDYVTWALESPVVTRAWEFPHRFGAGTVVVFFVNDRAEGSIIPSSPDVEAVQALLESRAPITSRPLALAPVEAPINPSIALRPNTQAVRDAVVAELQDLLLRSAAVETTIPISHLREAISRAAGEDDHELLSPTADWVPGTGALATLGVPVWSSL